MRSRSLAMLVARRLAVGVAIVVVVSIIVFAGIHAVPGSPEEAIGGPTATPAMLAEVRAAYHLDESFPAQYLDFARGAITLDFGRSYQTSQEVLPTVVEHLGITLQLAGLGVLLAAVLGVAGGVLAAGRRGGWLDRTLLGASIVGASVPAYATGVLLLYVFGVVLGWVPVSGAGEPGLDRLWHLLAPAATIAIVGAAPIMRLTRVAMLDALARDDVAFARARGLTRTTVLFRYSLRSAFVMIATALNSVCVYVLVATVVVERTFNLNGLGTFMIDAIGRTDVPVVLTTTLLLTVCIVLVNLAFDLLYTLADPRIDFEAVRR